MPINPNVQEAVRSASIEGDPESRCVKHHQFIRFAMLVNGLARKLPEIVVTSHNSPIYDECQTQ